MKLNEIELAVGGELYMQIHDWKDAINHKIESINIHTEFIKFENDSNQYSFSSIEHDLKNGWLKYIPSEEQKLKNRIKNLSEDIS